VLSGRVNPSGKLPVEVPRHAGGQPHTYLAAPSGRTATVSAAWTRPRHFRSDTVCPTARSATRLSAPMWSRSTPPAASN
jgi:hypothetical protein